MPSPLSHTPVLYEELLGSLRIFDDRANIIVDATLGLAGHAAGVVQKLGKNDTFIGLDCDEANLATAKARLESLLGEKSPSERPQIHYIHGNFRTLTEVLKQLNIAKITGIYADLGVSSVHFDTAERGFSFRFAGPLDMRLDVHQELTARDILREYSYEKLAETLRVYGDEPKTGWITKHILEARKIAPITTTEELANIVKPLSRDALPRVFQALRIAVNDEFGALETMLASAHDHLVPSGRLSIIAFHSGEDRIVKHFLREKSQGTIDPITGQIATPGTLQIITKKPIAPTSEEITRNPRARSGLLRVAERV